MRATRFSSWRVALGLAGALFIPTFAGDAQAIDFPGPDPGPSRAEIQGDTIVLENNVLKSTWTTAGGRLKPKEFVDKLDGKTLSLADSECFQIVVEGSPLPKSRVVNASELTTQGKPEKGSPFGYRFEGRQIRVEFKDGSSWQAILTDGANYVEQYVEWYPATLGWSFDRPSVTAAREIVLWDVRASGVRLAGSVDGCPLTAGHVFLACTSPLAQSEIMQSNERGTSVERCRVRVSVEEETRGFIRWDAFHRSVIGVAPNGQMRRAFRYYLERERRGPYRPFLHYNNGSEIGCEYWRKRLHKNVTEAEQFRMSQESLWLANIRAVGDELVKKRNVKIDAFVHDFEWDDETLVWQFHRGYPRGFAPAAAAAKEYGARVGVWLSPWGGYPGQPARIEFGRKMGFETSPGGLSLAGPRYYQRFSAACSKMIAEYGANYFKFDGFGAGNNQRGPGPYTSDVEALLRLMYDLRTTQVASDTPAPLFLNATTGSWPSPFWLLYADSIWRQGSDTGLLGKGSDRQQWITYRDNEVYHNVVLRSPLFPLNSLMIHGVYVNKLPLSGNPYDPKNPPASVHPKDVIDEIRSFFGTGVNCQEMYINPALMTDALWDALAEAANWSRRNADVLVDTHWIGGDPAKGEIYGYASWSKRQGILSLRNPDDKPAQIALDLGQAFELPPGAPTRYTLKSPWKQDAARPAIEVTAGRVHTFALEPFQVLVLEALPAGGK